MSRCPMRASKASERRGKRWRVPSSSCSEVESESESRESDHGGGGARGGLFSSTVVSKRRKRSGGSTFPLIENKLDIRESQKGATLAPTTFDQRMAHSTRCRGADLASADKRRGVEEEEVRGGVRRKAGVLRCGGDGAADDICTGSGTESDTDKESIGRARTVNSNCASEISRSQHNQCKQHNEDTLSLPPGDKHGWLTRRQKLNSSSSSASLEEGDLCRLKELFPQHSDDFLRGQLQTSAGVNEAVANILATDEPASSSQTSLRVSRRKTGRLCVPSDDSLLSGDDSCEGFPDVSCAAPPQDSAVAQRAGGRRRQVLDESVDDDTPRTTRRRHTRRVLTSDSGSEGETGCEREREEEREEEGEEEGEEGEEEEEEGEGERERSSLVEGGVRSSEEVGSNDSRASSLSTTHSKLSHFVYNKSRQFPKETHSTCSAGERDGYGWCHRNGGTRDGDLEGQSDRGSGGGKGRGRERRSEREGEGRESGRTVRKRSQKQFSGECGAGNGESEREEASDTHGSCSVSELSQSKNSTQPARMIDCSTKRKKKEPRPDLEELLNQDASDQSHYSDENDFSDRQKSSILHLLNSLSRDETRVIPGCSGTKATLLSAGKPFQSWEHLVEVISSTKGLSEQLLDGCLRLLEERTMLASLLSQCQSISSTIQRHVDTMREREITERERGVDTIRERERERENSGNESCDVVHFTLPTLLNPELVLKPYQRVGVAWLALLHSQNLNAILADEMGLGKTVQAIVFLAHLYEQGWRRPHLIVVPASTLDNWARELARWSPSLHVLTYWGTMSERADMRQEVMYGDGRDHYDVILSTYTVCIGRAEDRRFFRKLQLKTLVLDEGHMLKNMSTLKYTHLMRMQAERRLLLTGTPLQNNLLELMSLLSFVMPSVFRPYLQSLQTAFHHNRHTTQTGDYYTEQVSRAKEIMRPFILRRLKNEVLHQLPDKCESVEHCTLTPEQWRLYCSVVEQGRREMKDGTGKELVRSMSVLTKLRKAANHPLLLRNHYTNDIITKMSSEILKEEQYRDADPRLVEEDMLVMTDFELHNLCLQHPSLQQYSLSGELLKDSGKLQYLEEKLNEWRKQGNRMLLFSQFTMILDIVEAWLQLLGHTYLRLDGSTPMNERQTLIDLYNSSGDILVFLLSTKAGGLGINLTSANVVVLHDIDFNPYNDKQAEDRCHRVGQTREVQVIRLVGRNTIEEDILKCAEQKLKLEQDMTAGSQLSKTDIASLLCHSLNQTEWHATTSGTGVLSQVM